MFKENDFGFYLEAEKHFVFFGKKNCTLENLKSLYPKYEFRQTRQTHSDILIQSCSGSESTEADAQFTTEANVALIVRTADCIPALVYQAESEIILAVHAGWRGVENKILVKSLKKLQLENQINVYLGPHILLDSFQVDLAVKELLLPEPNQYYAQDNKFYVDLKSILIQQLQPFKVSEIKTLDFDTVSDLRFNSFRRDKENSGRNLSFIVKTKA